MFPWTWKRFVEFVVFTASTAGITRIAARHVRIMIHNTARGAHPMGMFEGAHSLTDAAGQRGANTRGAVGRWVGRFRCSTLFRTYSICRDGEGQVSAAITVGAAAIALTLAVRTP